MLDLITINPLPEAKLDPAGPFAGELDIQYSDVLVDGVRVRIGETMDFSRADPWSKLAIRAVKTLHDEGEFKGDITILEAGVGDGRNLLQAIGIGPHGGGVDADWKGRVVGIDIDPRRVALARANFEALGLAARADFLEGDAVHRMQEHAARVRSGEAPRLGGAAVACLPQAPLDAETHSSADGFDPRLPSFDRVRDIRLCGRPVADYGLTLNAAFLSELRDCADDNNFRSAPPRASAPAAWAVTTLRASARPVALRANRRARHSRASSPRPAPCARQAHRRGVGPRAAGGGAGALGAHGLGGGPLVCHAGAGPPGEAPPPPPRVAPPLSSTAHPLALLETILPFARSAATLPPLHSRGHLTRSVSRRRTRTRACSTSWTASSTTATTPGARRHRRRRRRRFF